jgi:flavin reductase (DIM6/NTAB) family NADH-FMN oxidoreductase RutF
MGEAFEREFCKAMRTLTSAVSIISTVHNNRRYGMTATAVASVSIAPPSLLVCINQSASLYGPTLASRRFCVNILYAHQDKLATIFSSKSAGDRFAFGEWAEDARNVPHLLQAQANVFCDLDDTHVYGTHTIVIGRVSNVYVRDQVNPLLYQDGRYTIGLGDGVDWVVPIAG